MSVMTELTVSKIMTKDPTQLRETSSVAYAIQMFDRFGFSIAPVVNDQNQLVGILSKNDLFHKLAQKRFQSIEIFENILVSEMMYTGDLISVRETASAQDAADLMLKNHLHHMFVTDATQKIVGVISSYDMMKAVAQPS